MNIKLKKEKFARNKWREHEVGSNFKKTSRGLSSFSNVLVALFFTPVLITTSLFSKEILLSFANILLSLGYLTNFCYRLYKKEVSNAELIVTLFALAGFLAGGFLLFPAVAPTIGVIGVIQIINQAATIINMFFLVRNLIVPPVQHLIEKLAQKIGFNISGEYYSKPALTLRKDRFAIDKALEKNYGHDSSSPEYKPEQLSNLNKLLAKLISYVDKYDKKLFGYIKNKGKITTVEQSIEQFTKVGDTDSSYSFIRKKIRFKKTKVTLLEEAAKDLQLVINNPHADQRKARSYFHERGASKDTFFHDGLIRINEEIKRQKAKISSLEECLPLTLKL